MYPSPVVGSPATQAGEALARQLSALQLLAGRLELARSTLPPASAVGVWTGPAHRYYQGRLERLHSQVGAAVSRVDDAISHTRRALAWGGGHAG
jgi:hypothetical protein